jgi:hypothetical protein
VDATYTTNFGTNNTLTSPSVGSPNEIGNEGFSVTLNGSEQEKVRSKIKSVKL